MKSKFIRLFSAAVMVVILATGCSLNKMSDRGQAKITDTEKKFTIATSFYPIYIFALNIAKDVPNVKVVSMSKPQTGCLHDYQLTPDDIKTLEKADVFVINGANMEAFLDKAVKQLPDLKIVDSSKEIELMRNSSTGEANPHVWVSISNAIVQVKNIGDELSKIDTENASKYKANTENYIKKLEAQRDKMHKALDGVKNRDIVTFHEAFPYFAKEFNLNIAAVIEQEPGSEPSASELADTINTVVKSNVKSLFTEPQYASKAAGTIAKETGAKIYVLDPVVTGADDADSYINLMDNNLKSLEEALK